MLQGEFLHPREYKQIFSLKHRLGSSLKSIFYRRALVSTRKTRTYQPTTTEGGFAGSAILQEELHQQLSPHHLRQYLSSVVHQQIGRHKVRSSLCADVENPHLVPQQQCNTQSKGCTRLTQCYRGWPLQEEPDPLNRVVTLSSDLQENFQNMGKSPGGPLRNRPEYKASSLCLPMPFLPLPFCPWLCKIFNFKCAGQS